MGEIFTFVFTDIENSTRLWEQYPEAMKLALEQHDSLLKNLIDAEGGQFVKSTGDGLLAVFSSTSQAIEMVVRAQRALSEASWKETGPLRVRMAVHSGEAETRQGDYFGQPLNRTARLMSLAHGGQVLISSTAASLVQDELPRDVELVDLGVHRLKDLERPEHVFQLVAEGLQRDFPALHSLDSIPNNLPVQLTSFVGRKEEIRKASALLDDHHLLTLTGPGGTGKTRLSLQLAADAMEAFPDGVWLVELAPITDPEMVTLGVANALAIPELPGRNLVKAITDFLRYKTSMIILDNCEHLIDACAVLAEQLLRTCPKLTILASSRESLGIAGESVMRVPPLSVPDLSSHDSSLGEDIVCSLQAYDSVHLFVERARTVTSDFELDGSNASAVAQICRRLDGIPLAIELAAARVRLLPPPQIARHLDDRFRLLTGGSRTALPRQQTLHALIEWSWDLLNEPEKTLLRRLAVFVGGFDLHAVEAVCAFDEDERWMVFDCLDDLVNKSLVVAGEENGEARFSLLESIRQFARDQLHESGEGVLVRDRHRDYYAGYVHAESANLRGREMARSLENLDREYENIRAVLGWGIENRWTGVVEMTCNLVDYWEQRRLKGDGQTWLKNVLDIIDTLPITEDAPDQVAMLQRRQAQKALLLASYAFININQIEYTQLVEIAESACELARSTGDQRVLAYALNSLSITNAFSGRFEEAARTGKESIRITRETGDYYLLGRGLMSMAMTMGEGYEDLDQASYYETEADRILELAPNPWLVAMLQFGRGAFYRQTGKLDLSRKSFQESIELFSEIKNEAMVTAARSDLAHLERQAGDICAAARLYRQTLPRWLEAGRVNPLAHQFESVSILCFASQKSDLSARFLGFAESLRAQSSDPRRPREDVEFNSTLEQLAEVMGEENLGRSRESGRKLLMEKAILLAMETLDGLVGEYC